MTGKVGNYKMLVLQPGWEDYLDELHYRIEQINKKWVKEIKPDSDDNKRLYMLAGEIKGLEWALKFVDTEVNEYQEQEPSQ